MADRANQSFLEEKIGLLAILLLSLLSATTASWPQAQKSNNPDRPQVPFGFTGLNSVQIGAYNSKAQPVAEAVQALNVMNQKGWQTIRKYYPTLGTESEKASEKVNPQDPEDRRFFAMRPTDDPGRSPMPLVVMICSLDVSDVSGNLKLLHDELREATSFEDFSDWPAERLHRAINELTQEQTTGKGVKYRVPKPTLSFKASVQLYAMTIALLGRDTVWTTWQDEAKKRGYSIPAPPDMIDFRNRLRRQLPMVIPPGATRGLLLYRPGWDIGEPIAKEEFEERADVVLIKRKGATFEVEQFPVYLTVDQKAWNPSWILSNDEQKDSTLAARKVEGLWTRLDGPYLWYKSDQLNGEDTYRSIVKFQKGAIIIEAERFVSPRRSVVRAARDRSYDPLTMQRFVAGVEVPADPLTVDPPDLDIWPTLWRQTNKNVNESFYRHDDRQLLWYKTGDNSWSSSLFPLRDAGPIFVEPIKPVTAPSGGLVARFSSSGAEQPSDVQPLSVEQQNSVGIAVGLMNLCLTNAGGVEVDALRVALPRDQATLTPVYFYSVRNGSSVRRSPNAMVVVLSEGYYNDYASAFNRLLWVLERPFESDAAKVSAINHAIETYLRDRYPQVTATPNDPALVAWSEILRGGGVPQLFDFTAIPGSSVAKAPQTAKSVGPDYLYPSRGEPSNAARREAMPASNAPH